MNQQNLPPGRKSLAADPVFVWLVIGLSTGIGLGVILDSVPAAVTTGMVLGTLVGIWLRSRAKL